MLEAHLTDCTHASFFIDQTDVVHITDPQRKKEIGFFVPTHLSNRFFEYLKQQENSKKIALLKKIAAAQQLDPIEETGVDDGLD